MSCAPSGDLPGHLSDGETRHGEQESPALINWLNDHPDILLVRRLQSEAQMLLYVHPLNDERAARGALRIRRSPPFWSSGTA